MKPLMKTLTATALLMASASPLLAMEEGKLTIWFGGNRQPERLAPVLEAFEADTGIPVEILDMDPDITTKYRQAASTGDGPDVIMYAHDNFGEWAASGIIQPITPSQDWTAGILPVALDAVSLDGKIWGYPIFVEAVGLLYNKGLAAEPAASFEELKDADFGEGVAPILWDYNNAYFTMPLLMANGGYAFTKVDGVYDGSTTGVNNEGSMIGGKVLRSLFDDGVMPEGVDYGVMSAAFAKGEAAMIINGPWSWAEYRDAGIDLGLAPLPSVAGAPAKPFVGVIAAAVNAASPNADLVAEFIENYMTTDEALLAWNGENPMGALADSSAAEAQNDPLLNAMLEGAAIGVPMPSNPEMGAFWNSMGPAFTNITTGQSAVEDALNDAAARILSE